MDLPAQKSSTAKKKPENGRRGGSSLESSSHAPESRTSASPEDRPRRRKQQCAMEGPNTLSTNGSAIIEQPMNKSTTLFKSTSDRDIVLSWVCRSSEVRKKQAKARKNQTIPRPMNSFMLYRLANAHRAKELLGVSNYQILNKAIGQSWNKESDAVKDFYSEMSQIERHNHQQTWPAYQYRPPGAPLLSAGETPSTPSPFTHAFDNNSTTWSDKGHSSLMFCFPPKPGRERDRPIEDDTTFELGTVGQSNTDQSEAMPTIKPPHVDAFLGFQSEYAPYGYSTMLSSNMQYEPLSNQVGLPGSTHEKFLETRGVPPLYCHHEDSKQDITPEMQPVYALDSSLLTGDQCPTCSMW